MKNKFFAYISWIIYSNILIYTSFYYNWKEQLIDRDLLVWTLLITISLITIVWMKKNKRILNVPISKLVVIAAGLVVAFLYFGKSFLYEETGYWMELYNVHNFLLLSLFVTIYITFSIVIFPLIKEDITIRDTDNLKRISYKYHYIILFVIQAAILGIYLYGLNPGNMSYDTYNQVSQLKRIIPYNTWHPIGHTLFMGLLLKIWNNYMVITIFQILFYVLITSSFYLFLIKNKIRWQIIYFSAIVVTLLPSVGINVVTLWKDIPFTLGLLWGTLILLKMNLLENYFAKILDALEFAVCMLIISLFRFNGILAFIAMFIYSFIYVVRGNKIQKRNYSISSVLIIVIFIFVNILIPRQLKAVPNPSGMKLRPVYQGYSAIYVYEGEGDLHKESRKLIESVCTPGQMRKFYNPYFADTISSNTPEFLKNLSKISSKDAIKIYVEALINHPGVVLGDKFNLSITMWSVTYDKFSYNNAYTTEIQKEMVEEFGVERKENMFTNIIKEFARYTMYENYLSNTLIWRTGFYLSLEIILLLYLILNKDKRVSLFIPVIGNGIIVFLTMPAQDYRYLWFIFLLFPFLVLSCSLDL
ncbi:MAG TPA: hypothetical protein GX396_00765 [Tissierellia bacterium]|jgi:hypothetical protein|nr:hypothetical protein [Tissierellia bacterium]